MQPKRSRLILLSFLLSTLTAQTPTTTTPATKLPTYDVATIRPNTSVNAGHSVYWRLETLQATDWNLRTNVGQRLSYPARPHLRTS